MADAKFTLIFEVRDADGNSVTAGPHKIEFEADRAELARDHYLELKNVFTEHVEDWNERTVEISTAANTIRETFEALGTVLWRAIRVKLREHYLKAIG